MPRYGRFYAFAVSLSVTKRYLLTFLLLASVAYGWFFWFYQGLHTRVVVMAQQVAELQHQQDFFYGSYDASKKLETLVYELSSELGINKLRAMGVDNHLFLWCALLEQAGLAIQACTPQSSHDVGWALRRPLQLVCIGSLSQIQTFLSSLCDAALQGGCQAVTISRTVDNQYTLSCTLTAYSIKND